MSLPEQNDRARLISAVRDFNPDTGSVILLTFTGTDDQMVTERAYWEARNDSEGTPLGYGYRTTTKKSASGTQLIVRLPEQQLLLDRWNINTETIQDAFWYSDYLRSYLQKPDGTSWIDTDLSTASGLLDWLWFIQRLEKLIGTVKSSAAGSVTTLASASATLFSEYVGSTATLLEANRRIAQVIYMAIRDGEWMERTRPILRRNRYVGIENATRTVITGRPLIYSTATLISTFDIPEDVEDQITDVSAGLPSTPPDTMWAWKLRMNDSELVIGSGKFMECRDWVWGRWSTIRHEVAS